MIIAVSVTEGNLSAHFGHCQMFYLFHTDKDKNIIQKEEKIPSAHKPGVFPKWLASEGANVIITGGMGMQAQRLFISNGIEVAMGASSGDPETIVRQWLDGTLISGGNICDH